MENLVDVQKRFRRLPFYKNAMLTMVIGFNYLFPKVIFILVANNKNALRSSFTTKSSYVSYLES